VAGVWFKFVGGAPVKVGRVLLDEALEHAWAQLKSKAFALPFKKGISGSEAASGFGLGDMVVSVGSALRFGSFGTYVARCAPVDLEDAPSSPCFHANLYDHPGVREHVSDAIRSWMEEDLRDRGESVAADEVEEPLRDLVGFWSADRVTEPADYNPVTFSSADDWLAAHGVIPGVYELLPGSTGALLTARLRQPRGAANACRAVSGEAFTLGVAELGSIRPLHLGSCQSPPAQRAKPVGARFTRRGRDAIEGCWGGIGPDDHPRACVLFRRTDAAGGTPNG
jgi:hypothetical protein